MNTDPSSLGPDARARARSMVGSGVDLLVVGGGVTGCGIALDAAARGLKVALIEQRDFASGTSSRSSKLIHGGVRYLEQLRFRLVREALRERALLLRTLAPHLVTPVPMLFPLRGQFWERGYVGAGFTLYDSLGGLHPVLPRHRHLSRAATLGRFPDLRQQDLRGAVAFFDAQVDDARHTVELARTAAKHGALLLSGTRFRGVLSAAGRVVGAEVTDTVEGDEYCIPARVVVNATGPWAGQTEALAGVAGPLQMRPSKGVHIVVPRDRIRATCALISRTRSSVLFVLPWDASWIIGTTDTAWRHGLDHPSAHQGDIDYLLTESNRLLLSDLSEQDITGIYAGVRPLVGSDGASESQLSREHVIREGRPGLITITGGKYTTYRVMAQQAVDACRSTLGSLPASSTERIPLIGAGDPALLERSLVSAAPGVDPNTLARLTRRYGRLAGELLAEIEREPQLADPIEGGAGAIAGEVRYAVTHEGALTVDDILTRRTRIYLEAGDRGVTAVPQVAEIMAAVLGWSPERRAAEVQRYLARVEAERLAQGAPSDDESARLRTQVKDPRIVSAS